MSWHSVGIESLGVATLRDCGGSLSVGDGCGHGGPRLGAGWGDGYGDMTGEGWGDGFALGHGDDRGDGYGYGNDNGDGASSS